MPVLTTSQALAANLDERARRPAVRADRPTHYLDGDPRKDSIMEARARLLLPLRHKDDAQLPDGWDWGPWLDADGVPQRMRGDNGREARRTLYDAEGQPVLELWLERGQWRYTIYHDYPGRI